jgi:multidrug resistance protein MdtO
MWLAFDQLWSAPLAAEMKGAFVSSLRLLAQFGREPISKDLGVAAERAFSLREMINSTFDEVRALADAVLLETGPSRERDLALRSRIRSWQLQLRMLFIMRVALWRYRIRVSSFELPAPVAAAQQEFNGRLADMLDGMADRTSGRKPDGRNDFGNSAERLEKAIRTYDSGQCQEVLPSQLRGFLSLSRTIASLTISLDHEMSVQGETLRQEMLK